MTQGVVTLTLMYKRKLDIDVATKEQSRHLLKPESERHSESKVKL